MLSKFFAAVVLAVILIFVEGTQADAREVYVGHYSDGSAVYLLTETIEKKVGMHFVSYDCTVRAGRDYLNYTFSKYYRDSSWDYKNSEGYSGNINDGSSPVARAILNYCVNH